ncbi:MAG: Asp23/Gls24 family envelope stress response protein [Chloroflexota bacterium]|nr:Asp23/Gls24 family envelope stress response protein [Dehalococcoidia bacterium]MDW8252555.1 Asp23/Gls24 family envelope stress response protein [Chloroflexota bacterium]
MAVPPSSSAPDDRSPAAPRGSVGLSANAIAVIAGRAAIECYGVVGMASRRPIDGIVRLLNRSNLSRGVDVRIVDDVIDIDLYVIVEYGTKISEVAHNLQSAVKFAVERAVGMPVRSVNVNIQDLHIPPSRE